MLLLSHVAFILIKSYLHLLILLPADCSEPGVYGFLAFEVANVTCIFCCVGHFGHSI
jgi:hypothetical protein